MSLYKPNLFTYPGYRLPGVDLSHPAAFGMAPNHALSIVSIGGAAHIDLLTGKKGAPSTALTALIDPTIGPNVNFGTTNVAETFSGMNSTSIDATGTFASIFIFNSAPANAWLFSSNNTNTNNGVSIGFNNTTGLALSSGSTGTGFANSTTLPTALAVNIPYFFLVSWTLVGTTYNASWFIENLFNGTYQLLGSQNNTGKSAPAAGSGSYLINNAGSISFLQGRAKIAVLMYNPGLYLTASQILSFGADPWAFWYPRTITDLVFDGLSGPTGPPLPVLTLMPQTLAC